MNPLYTQSPDLVAGSLARLSILRQLCQQEVVEKRGGSRSATMVVGAASPKAERLGPDPP